MSQVQHGGAAIGAHAREWFEQRWDPELTLGEWWRRLAESGWGFPTWPTEWYGRGVAPHLARVVTDVRRQVGAVGPPAGIAQNLAGPTIIAHGTDEQKRRWLPGVVAGEIWCQLFSEPGAGSDLASLQTRAVRDGDEWVVNGQKVWTSGAQVARYGILVARTDRRVPKHQGLSYFVIDMDQPGIEVRPIREMSGRAIFNEVFLADARVPTANLIGAPGDGWAAALTTLANERTMLGAANFATTGGSASISRPDLGARVGDLARGAGPDAAHTGAAALLLDALRASGRAGDPVVRQEVAQLYSLVEIARYTACEPGPPSTPAAAPAPRCRSASWRPRTYCAPCATPSTGCAARRPRCGATTPRSAGGCTTSASPAT